MKTLRPLTARHLQKLPVRLPKNIELAVEAAHKAAPEWNNSSATTRSNLLWKIADVMEENLEMLARAETWDNGRTDSGNDGGRFAAGS